MHRPRRTARASAAASILPHSKGICTPKAIQALASFTKRKTASRRPLQRLRAGRIIWRKFYDIAKGGLRPSRWRPCNGSASFTRSKLSSGACLQNGAWKSGKPAASHSPKPLSPGWRQQTRPPLRPRQSHKPSATASAFGRPDPLPRRRPPRDRYEHGRAGDPPLALNRKNALLAGSDDAALTGRSSLPSSSTFHLVEGSAMPR
jgi:hypothetical protein